MEPILKATDLTLSYGDKTVLDRVSLELRSGETAVLVGPNGSGKSSLLKILAGLIPADGGRLSVYRRGLPAVALTVGYLPQNLDDVLRGRSGEEVSLFEAVLSTFAEVSGPARDLHAAEQALLADRRSERVLQAYGEASHRFEAAGGYVLQARVEAALRRVGLAPEETRRPAVALSGGQKTRALLAGLLARDPDLLLLDEPTNHLDVETMVWLEGFLSAADQAALITSHDRRFIDRVGDRVLDLRRGRLTEYPGNFSVYRALREAESRRHEEEWAERERRRRQLTEAADRQMRWAQQAHAAAGTNDFLRRLAKKGHKRAKATANRLRRLVEEGVEKPWVDETVRVEVAPPPKAGGTLMTLKDVGLSYGESVVFEGLNLFVQPGDRLAVVGPNGSGKTSLLRLMAAEIAPTEGEIHRSPALRLGHLRQELDHMLPTALPFDMVVEAFRAGAGRTPSRSEVRTYLASFLFQGDDAYRPVGALSLGERARLALACLFRGRPQLLLLDEPTNHLDLDSREAVERALEILGSTMVLVSHDRAFLERLATRVLDLEPPGPPVVYAGGYVYFESKKGGGAG